MIYFIVLIQHSTLPNHNSMKIKIEGKKKEEKSRYRRKGTRSKAKKKNNYRDQKASNHSESAVDKEGRERRECVDKS